MPTPPVFQETRTDVLHALIRAHPFATLISLSQDSPVADHLPMVLHPEDNVLRGHLARSNPLVRVPDAAPVPVLAIFHGAQHYVSPGWYPSKAQHGKVVPTWNYEVVHVRGLLHPRHDPTWLLDHLSAVSAHNETGQPVPWSPSDAPAAFIDRQLRALAGIEIEITGLSGIRKLSQNREAADRQGVVDGLHSTQTEAARHMASLIDTDPGSE